MISIILPIAIVWCCTICVCYLGKVWSRGTAAAAAATRRLQAAGLPEAAAASFPGRLRPEVLAALPVFLHHSADDGKEKLECPVCLMEFRDGEKGRTLPRCGHKFHVECVDMWFDSHSNCPLCRSTVEPEEADDGQPPV